MDYGKEVIKEMNGVCSLIREEDIDRVGDMILEANRVLVVGVGRVLISLKAWVKRLRHIGVDINFVGSETEGAVHEKDLLIVASSSGESAVPVQIAKIAKKYGVKIVYIGCNPQSTAGLLSDFAMKIPCKTKLGLPGEFPSFQPMSTLFEQVLYILGDVIAYTIMDKKKFDEEEVKNNHANLE
ncbi:MAG: SIS domain-containing protein [bacterium]